MVETFRGNVSHFNFTTENWNIGPAAAAAGQLCQQIISEAGQSFEFIEVKLDLLLGRQNLNQKHVKAKFLSFSTSELFPDVSKPTAFRLSNDGLGGDVSSVCPLQDRCGVDTALAHQQ